MHKIMHWSFSGAAAGQRSTIIWRQSAGTWPTAAQLAKAYTFGNLATSRQQTHTSFNTQFHFSICAKNILVDMQYETLILDLLLQLLDSLYDPGCSFWSSCLKWPFKVYRFVPQSDNFKRQWDPQGLPFLFRRRVSRGAALPYWKCSLLWSAAIPGEWLFSSVGRCATSTLPPGSGGTKGMGENASVLFESWIS